MVANGPSVAVPYADTVLRDALVAARAMSDRGPRRYVPAHVVPRLPETERAAALHAAVGLARPMSDDVTGVHDLSLLAQHADDERNAVLPAVLLVDGLISDYYPGAHVLGALAPRLPENVRDRIRDGAFAAAARAIYDEDWLAEFLAELALSLAQSELRDSLAAIGKDCSGGRAQLENPTPEPVGCYRIR